jgi:hypothetical protein
MIITTEHTDYTETSDLAHSMPSVLPAAKTFDYRSGDDFPKTKSTRCCNVGWLPNQS